jgi:uncharacterized protein (TIGR00251 family)
LEDKSAELIEINEKNGTVTFKIRAQPRAAKTEMAGEYAGALKLRIAAPPVDGKANDEVIKFFSKLFDIPNRNVEIVSGDSSRDKIIRIHNVSMAQAQALLNQTP